MWGGFSSISVISQIKKQSDTSVRFSFVLGLTFELGKYSYLIKNVGLLAVGSFATKLLSFFLVPLYTSALTTGEYGTYDLLTATVGILVPILTLNVQEAVLRFAMDKDVDREALATVGMRYSLIASFVLAVVLGLTVFSGVVPLEPLLALFFWLFFVVQAFSGLVSCYARGIGLIRDLSVSGVVAAAVTIFLNIVLLLPLHMGLDGYFLANILGPFVQVAYLVHKTRLVADAHPRRPYRLFRKEITAYSKPLIANSIAWWVNSLADRYIVTFFCGIATNGIYSVASKIPTILNVFQTIFNQAWSLSSTKSFDPEDGDGFFANTYRAYNCFMTIVCSAVILADKPLASFLYANDFYVAWQYVPWLTIAILFGALVGFLEGIFIAVKDSKTPAKCTIAGAVTNIALNFALTPLFGALGAAIATTVCYLEIWVARLWLSRRYVRFRINIVRDVASYALLVAQSVIVLTIGDEVLMYAVAGVMFALIATLYIKDIAPIAKKVLMAVRGRQ